MLHHVFISYAFEDRPVAEAACEALETHGIKCWIAQRDILPGRSYGGAIINAINQSRIFILILSSKSNNSQHVIREVERAVSKGIPLLPFRIEDIELSLDMQYLIGVPQWLDALDRPIEKHFGRLVESIQTWMSAGASQEPDRVASPIQVPELPPRRQETASAITQVVGVSYTRDTVGREGLVFSPVPLPGEPALSPIERQIQWNAVRRHGERLREEIRVLNRCAGLGQKREDARLEEAARELSSELIPEGGFAAMVRPGIHPQLDIIQDAASEIPWEVLFETCMECPRCGTRVIGAAPRYTASCACPKDRVPMRPASVPLVLNYQLSYLVRGERRSVQPGKKFLMIEDPTGGLCASSRPEGKKCLQHCDELAGMLESRGYRTDRIRSRQATVGRVVSALADPSLAGVYFFGHGYFPRDGFEGCLILADGPLTASQIKGAAPGARFVFLNTCGGPEVEDWILDRRSRSVADAFAQGDSSSVVISPLWPLFSTYAAEAALEFFRMVCTGPGLDSTTLGEALHKARESSFARYQAGEPHLAWMAYRYLGDPNKGMPQTELPVLLGASALETGHLLCRVFDDTAQLNTEIFAFDIEGVLLRAAKRRNFQDRRRLTVTDFIAGIVRKGELTRYALRQIGADPDEVYGRIGDWLEEEVQDSPTLAPRHPGLDLASLTPPAATADGEECQDVHNAPLRDTIARWTVRREEEFSADLVEILISADEASQSRTEEATGRRISEQDMLQSLIASCTWNELNSMGLPLPGDIQRILSERQESGYVDENGTVCLDDLTAEARKVIETAHLLAQQRGVSPITNRLFIAALVADSNSYAANVIRSSGSDPELLFLVMIAATEEKGDAGHSFALSTEVCSRIVTPVLEKARTTASDPQALTEKDLFEAFCTNAPTEFKQALRSSGLVDLEAIGHAEVSAQLCGTGPVKDSGARIGGVRRQEFDSRTWRLLQQSARLARGQGSAAIRTPHLFAAMIGEVSGPVASALRRNKIDMDRLKDVVMSLVPRQGAPLGESAPTILSENAGKVVVRAVREAHTAGRDRATAEDLLASFFADGGGIVGQLLDQLALPPAILFEGGPATTDLPSEGRRSVLAALGRDLTEKARAGQLPVIAGRDAEIETAIQSLLLMENASPLLVGEDGVGKTAIVEGIAQRIVRGDCPERLRSLRIVEISPGALVADIRHPGESEHRMRDLLEEVRQTNVVLFIDEVHTLVGAGIGRGGPPDAGSMLKSALVRGEARVIGATTPPEYRRAFEADKVWRKRFQVQLIGPTSRQGTLEVLSARQRQLERHHGVEITEEAKTAAVDLSGSYVVDRNWPAKALDALERACIAATTHAGAAPGPFAVTRQHVVGVIAAQTGMPVERLSALGKATAD